jgi:glutathione S-transferase
MTLEEKQIPYTLIEEDLAQLSPELLNLHPEGKVPLLIHGDEVIYESSVITEYLDEISGPTHLMPSDPTLRARVRLWTYWCNELFKPDLDLFKYELKQLSPVQTEALSNRIRGHLKKLSQPLESQSFLMGEELNLADIHVFPFYRQLQKSNPHFFNLFETTKIDLWLNRVVSRPSFDRTMQKMIPSEQISAATKKK